MNILPSDLEKAVSQNIISQDQSDALLQMLQQRSAHQASFNFTKILYYFVGLITIGLLSVYMPLSWVHFGAKGLIAITSGYLILSLALTEYFLRTKNLLIPAGITATIAVTLIPLLIYGIQYAMGYWDHDTTVNHQNYHRFIDWRRLIMELSTLAVGSILCWHYRLRFMMMPIAVILWYMSMDLAPMLYQEDIAWNNLQMVSVSVGLCILMLAFVIDILSSSKKSHKDYAFWLYIFGVIAFWGGLTSMDSISVFSKMIYCLINIGMIMLGAIIKREVFVVFGVTGVAGYLVYLSLYVFRTNVSFPFVLTLIGFGIIPFGIWWQKNEEKIFGKIRKKLLPQLF